ncbi:putative nuclease HARBI1 [Smittium culicis]|uniref:Putative nuclease HARBI1 n=1 Tax=Smittium culicis TaxID=133412 RepID=A0A1R1YB02_9FUNG|nr:putative nuclease HARBI1 [Smittium culicis]
MDQDKFNKYYNHESTYMIQKDDENIDYESEFKNLSPEDPGAAYYRDNKWKHWKPPKKASDSRKNERLSKNSNEFQAKTWELPEKEFLKKLRLRKETFLFLENLIEKDPVFLNDSKNAQTDVRFQLFVALYRLGSSEKQTSISRIAEETGKANGTISLYTERVLKALNNISRSYISWPNNEERIELEDNFFSSFNVRNTIGVLSPVEIYFTQRPAISPLSYQFSDQNNGNAYGVSSLIVCDNKYYIRFLGNFFPGSQEQKKMWESSIISQNPERYFKNTQLVMSDQINNTPHVLSPSYPEFTDQDIAINLSIINTQRVVKKTVHLWKSRWGSLHHMKKQLKKPGDFEKVENWIRATAVLHNIACELEDEWIEDIDF